MAHTDYPQHEFLPRGLSKEEIENPYDILQAFFDVAHLPQHRQDLRLLLNVTVTGTFNSCLSPKERADILFCYSWYEKLIEACHLIYEQHRN